MNSLLVPVAAIMLVLVTTAACSKEDDQPTRNFVAYSWNKVPSAYSNIINFHWLKSADIENLEQGVSNAVTATQKMPEGYRALFSWDIHRKMALQVNGDFLLTANGEVAGCNSEQGFKPYRSIWWEKGTESVRREFEEFFKLYRESGGKLDVFVLDFEQGFSYWHLVDLIEKNYKCGLDHYLDAIQNDSRFLDIKQSLEIGDFKSINLWHKNDDHLKWAAFGWQHLAKYINSAIYQPLKDYFPDAELSNYGYYYQSSRFDFPDIYGSNIQRYTDGVHVGTHQSREIYGWLSFSEGSRLGGIDYPITPFNAFRFAVNKLRAMLLSSDVPVSPWVAYKGFKNSHLKDNDFYQELIFHVLLSGVDYLLYWNPAEQADHSPDDDKLLDQLLTRVNALIDNQMLSYNTTELVNWLDDIVITKIQIGEKSQLWRVSADIGIEENIEDRVVQTNPAKININNKVYQFDSMMVLDDKDIKSDKGLWLISN